MTDFRHQDAVFKAEIVVVLDFARQEQIRPACHCLRCQERPRTTTQGHLLNQPSGETGMLHASHLKLDGTATAWTRGVPTTVEPDADGFVNFYLAPGEGVFVTVAP